MPIYSDLNLYYGSSSLTSPTPYYSSLGLGLPPRSGYSGGKMGLLPPPRLLPSRMGYLPTISESSSLSVLLPRRPLPPLSRISSPRIVPSYLPPKTIRMDTADIDVSTPRIPRAEREREQQQQEQQEQRSDPSRQGTIKRGRTIVRLHTKKPKDNPALERRKQTPGERLMEKFLIKDKAEEAAKEERRKRLEELERLERLQAEAAKQQTQAQEISGVVTPDVEEPPPAVILSENAALDILVSTQEEVDSHADEISRTEEPRKRATKSKANKTVKDKTGKKKTKTRDLGRQVSEPSDMLWMMTDEPPIGKSTLQRRNTIKKMRRNSQDLLEPDSCPSSRRSSMDVDTPATVIEELEMKLEKKMTVKRKKGAKHKIIADITVDNAVTVGPTLKSPIKFVVDEIQVEEMPASPRSAAKKFRYEVIVEDVHENQQSRTSGKENKAIVDTKNKKTKGAFGKQLTNQQASKTPKSLDERGKQPQIKGKESNKDCTINKTSNAFQNSQQSTIENQISETLIPQETLDSKPDVKQATTEPDISSTKQQSTISLASKTTTPTKDEFSVQKTQETDTKKITSDDKNKKLAVRNKEANSEAIKDTAPERDEGYVSKRRRSSDLSIPKIKDKDVKKGVFAVEKKKSPLMTKIIPKVEDLKCGKRVVEKRVDDKKKGPKRQGDPVIPPTPVELQSPEDTGVNFWAFLNSLDDEYKPATLTLDLVTVPEVEQNRSPSPVSTAPKSLFKDDIKQVQEFISTLVDQEERKPETISKQVVESSKTTKTPIDAVPKSKDIKTAVKPSDEKPVPKWNVGKIAEKKPVQTGKANDVFEISSKPLSSNTGQQIYKTTYAGNNVQKTPDNGSSPISTDAARDDSSTGDDFLGNISPTPLQETSEIEVEPKYTTDLHKPLPAISSKPTDTKSLTKTPESSELEEKRVPKWKASKPSEIQKTPVPKDRDNKVIDCCTKPSSPVTKVSADIDTPVLQLGDAVKEKFVKTVTSFTDVATTQCETPSDVDFWGGITSTPTTDTPKRVVEQKSTAELRKTPSTPTEVALKLSDTKPISMIPESPKPEEKRVPKWKVGKPAEIPKKSALKGKVSNVPEINQKPLSPVQKAITDIDTPVEKIANSEKEESAKGVAPDVDVATTRSDTPSEDDFWGVITSTSTTDTPKLDIEQKSTAEFNKTPFTLAVLAPKLSDTKPLTKTQESPKPEEKDVPKWKVGKSAEVPKKAAPKEKVNMVPENNQKLLSSVQKAFTDTDTPVEKISNAVKEESATGVVPDVDVATTRSETPLEDDFWGVITSTSTPDEPNLEAKSKSTPVLPVTHSTPEEVSPKPTDTKSLTKTTEFPKPEDKRVLKLKVGKHADILKKPLSKDKDNNIADGSTKPLSPVVKTHTDAVTSLQNVANTTKEKDSKDVYTVSDVAVTQSDSPSEDDFWGLMTSTPTPETSKLEIEPKSTAVLPKTPSTPTTTSPKPIDTKSLTKTPESPKPEEKRVPKWKIGKPAELPKKPIIKDKINKVSGSDSQPPSPVLKTHTPEEKIEDTKPVVKDTAVCEKDHSFLVKESDGGNNAKPIEVKPLPQDEPVPPKSPTTTAAITLKPKPESQKPDDKPVPKLKVGKPTELPKKPLPKDKTNKETERGSKPSSSTAKTLTEKIEDADKDARKAVENTVNMISPTGEENVTVITKLTNVKQPNKAAKEQVPQVDQVSKLSQELQTDSENNKSELKTKGTPKLKIAGKPPTVDLNKVGVPKTPKAGDKAGKPPLKALNKQSEAISDTESAAKETTDISTPIDTTPVTPKTPQLEEKQKTPDSPKPAPKIPVEDSKPKDTGAKPKPKFVKPEAKEAVSNITKTTDSDSEPKEVVCTESASSSKDTKGEDTLSTITTTPTTPIDIPKDNAVATKHKDSSSKSEEGIVQAEETGSASKLKGAIKKKKDGSSDKSAGKKSKEMKKSKSEDGVTAVAAGAEEEEEEDTSSEEEEDDNDTSSEATQRASTSSDDSGFDSMPTSVPGSPASNKKAPSSTSSEGRDPGSPAPSLASNPSLDPYDDGAGTPRPGWHTPPAVSLPRFRKYTVDDFQFLKVLGKGSFGKVLLAELRGTERYYAVKCLKKDVVLEDDDVECTLIERKVLALGTKHPYLCHLFCTFQTESHLLFVMEYLNGGDLMFHIQQSGRFQEPRARFYAAEIVCGLKFLHKKGIVYRDLKLDNILLDFDGHVRIADFGMCKLQIFLERTADTFCGTPDYMAPEIIKGLKYNQCVDWWSFGVLLFEMLVGVSPFSGCDEDELFWSICNEQPLYPRFLSREASSILTLLLEKDAAKRLGTPDGSAGDVVDQPFFRNMDWTALEHRDLEPPYKPRVQHPLDVQYFDRAFTAERAVLTPIDKGILQSMDQTQFQGFSYTNPNATD